MTHKSRFAHAKTRKKAEKRETARHPHPGAGWMGFASFVFFALFAFLSAAHAQTAPSVPEAARQKIVASSPQVPLSFEANRGQTDAQVQFLSRGSGYTLFLTPGEAVLSLRRPTRFVQTSPPNPLFRGERGNGEEILECGSHAPAFSGKAMLCRKPPGSTTSGDQGASTACALQDQDQTLPALPDPTVMDVLRLRLLGANPDPAVAGLDAQPGVSHYFLGSDPAKWRANVPHVGKVLYREVYPGIDLVYYGTDQRRLEHDFVVAPGADPGLIRFEVDGADSLRLDDDGNLVLHTPGGEVVLQAPVAYQEIGGVRRSVESRFVLRPIPLTPFPEGKGERASLLPSPFRGGAGGGVSFSLAPYDPSHPLIIDPALTYSTYLGGSGEDVGYRIVVDVSGNVYVVGRWSQVGRRGGQRLCMESVGYPLRWGANGKEVSHIVEMGIVGDDRIAAADEGRDHVRLVG